jgi:hypothetical protein
VEQEELQSQTGSEGLSIVYQQHSAFQTSLGMTEWLTRTLEYLGTYRFGEMRHVSVLGPHFEDILASLALMEEKAFRVVTFGS